jgi:hypothetical protein
MSLDVADHEFLLDVRRTGMMADLLADNTETSPRPSRLGIPKWVKLLVVVDAVVLAVALGVFAVLHRSDERENIVNAGYRGSRPPAGQQVPDLSKVRGISPALPATSTFKGAPTLYVATCMKCPSGDIVGGAMRRLGERSFPKGTHVEIIAWQGDAATWRSDWQIPASLPIHVVTGAASIYDVKRTLGIGDYGFSYLYDSAGTWRASYALQTMLPEDIVHDMGVAAG